MTQESVAKCFFFSSCANSFLGVSIQDERIWVLPLLLKGIEGASLNSQNSIQTFCVHSCACCTGSCGLIRAVGAIEITDMRMA